MGKKFLLDPGSPKESKVLTHDMNRKSIQTVLIIAISFALPVTWACVGYYTVASADFLSSNLGFEAFDQEYLAAANQTELKIFDSSNFLKTVQLEIFPIGLFHLLSSQIFPLDQRTSVLRC